MNAATKYNKKVGIHAHNNQQLAFANTIEAVGDGVDWLDATCFMENPSYIPAGTTLPMSPSIRLPFRSLYPITGETTIAFLHFKEPDRGKGREITDENQQHMCAGRLYAGERGAPPDPHYSEHDI